jgi:deazaflavin-dependent oxidoreductase (nitroreductase family)
VLFLCRDGEICSGEYSEAAGKPVSEVFRRGAAKFLPARRVHRVAHPFSDHALADPLFANANDRQHREKGIAAMKMDRLSDQLAGWLSAQHVFFYRLTAGLGPFDRHICILTTRGRKTGHEISKPLWYYEQHGRLHIIASHGGSDLPPAWYLNLVANPEVQVEIGWSRKRYRARALSDEEAKALWPEILKRNPLYAGYQKMTSRRIPIVELAPWRSQAASTSCERSDQ